MLGVSQYMYVGVFIKNIQRHKALTDKRSQAYTKTTNAGTRERRTLAVLPVVADADDELLLGVVHVGRRHHRVPDDLRV